MSAMLATAMVPVATSYTSAQVVIPTNRSALVQQNELQMLENRLQRQQFQQQQQQFRDQDRQIVPPQRPTVPVIRPSCQLQPSGGGFVTVCR
ncbi:MAG: hypothetical protein ABJB10_09170 [Mesorhizobium sp.]